MFDDAGLVQGLMASMLDRIEASAQRQAVAMRLDLEGMSKSAQKKAIRRELRRQQFVEGRKEEKSRAQKRSRQRNQALWQERRSLIESGQLTEAEALAEAINTDTGRVSKKVRQQRKQRLNDAYQSDRTQRVVIDCAFDDVMTDRELVSFRHQIRLLYGSNARAEAPVKLALTGMSDDAIGAFAAESERWLLGQHRACYTELYPPADLVYLSADADQAVDQLDSSKVYIIGGLVDHNRLKGVCHDKARRQGVAVRSLPIADYLQGSARRVLTVNQVFDILVQYGACRDWRAAFERVIPARKGFQPKPVPSPSANPSSN